MTDEFRSWSHRYNLRAVDDDRVVVFSILDRIQQDFCRLTAADVKALLAFSLFYIVSDAISF